MNKKTITKGLISAILISSLVTGCKSNNLDGTEIQGRLNIKTNTTTDLPNFINPSAGYYVALVTPSGVSSLQFVMKNKLEKANSDYKQVKRKIVVTDPNGGNTSIDSLHGDFLAANNYESSFSIPLKTVIDGFYKFQVTLDLDNIAKESNEKDNEFIIEKEFKSDELPTGDIGAAYSKGYDTDTKIYSYEVCNLNPSVLYSGFTIKSELSVLDTTNSTYKLVSTKDNENVQYSLTNERPCVTFLQYMAYPTSLPSGEYQLKVTTDSTNAFTESNEENISTFTFKHTL